MKRGGGVHVAVFSGQQKRTSPKRWAKKIAKGGPIWKNNGRTDTLLAWETRGRTRARKKELLLIPGPGAGDPRIPPSGGLDNTSGQVWPALKFSGGWKNKAVLFQIGIGLQHGYDKVANNMESRGRKKIPVQKVA